MKKKLKDINNFLLKFMDSFKDFLFFLPHFVILLIAICRLKYTIKSSLNRCKANILCLVELISQRMIFMNVFWLYVLLDGN